MEDGYGTAAVCRRGHVASNDLRLSATHATRCTECGSDLVYQCLACGTPVRGEYFVGGVISFATWGPQDFCHACGDPLPWASWSSRLTALDNVAEHADLDPATRRRVASVLEEIGRDGEGYDLASEVAAWTRLVDLWPGVRSPAAWRYAAPLISQRAKAQMDLLNSESE